MLLAAKLTDKGTQHDGYYEYRHHSRVIHCLY